LAPPAQTATSIWSPGVDPFFNVTALDDAAAARAPQPGAAP
jgi:hypothetical protein